MRRSTVDLRAWLIIAGLLVLEVAIAVARAAYPLDCPAATGAGSDCPLLRNSLPHSIVVAIGIMTAAALGAVVLVRTGELWMAGKRR